MTVKDLIKHLRKWPGDTTVAYQIYSGMQPLNEYPQMLKVFKEHNGHGWLGEYHEGQWKEGDPKPEVFAALVFPGN